MKDLEQVRDDLIAAADTAEDHETIARVREEMHAFLTTGRAQQVDETFLADAVNKFGAATAMRRHRLEERDRLIAAAEAAEDHRILEGVRREMQEFLRVGNAMLSAQDLTLTAPFRDALTRLLTEAREQFDRALLGRARELDRAS